MTGKNVAQRMDSMEEAMGAAQEEFQLEMGSLKDEIQTMNKRFEQFIKLQEDTGGSYSYRGEKMLSPNFGSGSSSSGTRHDFRFRKLEKPLFDGSNPDGWILKAERYFSVNRLSNEEKLEAAIIAFEGDALLWYQWENRKRSMMVWEEIKNITDEQALGNFINGLKPEIRVEVRIMEPSNLGRAMDLAQKIEEKLWKKELTILLTYDMDEAEQEEEEGSGEGDPELETAEINQGVEVSLNSVVGLTTLKMMKLKGTIGEQEVVVLIDSDLVSKMRIPIVKIGTYGVTMGAGAVVRGEGLCRGVTIHLQGIDIVEEFLPLGLGSSDAILGVMKFMLGNESVTLRGDPSLGKTLVSLKAMMRTIKHE
ncbi:hypothetical protein CICLE_v10030074mg [Citrus x clementina]|uniref:Retrotransposon gag domain-containing protein n=1 Tax=Citrus clementina TaxID=85681 RepID=V4UDR6_CITCL|nr:hypothetical protein CICLE_v10030074mg [Citrus x clementina]